MRMRSTLTIKAAAVVALLLAGCGAEEPDDVSVTGADETSTSTTEADVGDETDGGEADGGGTDGGDEADGDGTDGEAPTPTTGAGDGGSGGTAEPGDEETTEIVSDQIVLSDVAIGREGNVERVVFEFEGPQTPTHELRWVERPILSAGEGAEVEVDGDAILEIAMFPASPVRMDGEDVEEVYTGGDRLEGAGGVVNEAVMFGAFEARLEWAIGLQREVPYKVIELTDPMRIVVELQTGG